MLKLATGNKTNVVEVCGTKFHIRAMSIKQKEKLCADLAAVPSQVKGDGTSFSRIMDLLTTAIVKIEVEGFDHSAVRDILDSLEDASQLREIITAVISSCGLTPAEAKNSVSSPVSSTPESVGNAASDASQENGPASSEV
jgi:hypothetical protein